MKGEWIQAASGTWHLIWERNNLVIAEGTVITWCNRTLAWDDPTKAGDRFSFEDILHDECVRKSEEL